MPDLSEFCEPGSPITYGVVQPGPTDPNGVKFIRGGDVSDGKIAESELRTISAEVSNQYKRTILRGGELLVSLVGNPGEVALVPSHMAGLNIARQVAMVRLSNQINSKFLMYFLMSPMGRSALGAQAIGSVQSVINLRDLKRVEVPNIERSTQDKIAEILGTLDDKIELNRRMNETLEEMARALFRDWFVEFGPTRRQMAMKEKGIATDPAAIMGHAFPPEKAATLAPLFPTKLGDDGLPEGWETRDLRSALTLNYGKSLTKKARRPGPFNVFGSGGISGTHDTALAKGPSIIVGRKGTVGSLYWTREDFYAIDTVFYVTSDYPMVYCHRLLETLGLETMNTDAAVPGLNRDNAYRQEFAFGGDALIHAYAEFVGNLTEKSDANQQENQTLAEMRDLLLPKLMSGEIRLKDAEAAE
ncbi:restriction endonuclease subunit S [Phaeobacter inhibens]|uniref:restriction endonuclease subunit S n=1 Tax=Phaeobacter inhibens TaxID=221822 RepID=UPI000160EA29|nr:restriction endonuclease subunit S [Phaeobacter inhibens]AFO86751.1 putative type I restriction modification system, DNA specificity domain protein [Phaeobacter inhibens 2.10]AXT41564.1 restriction endonuclease subunit S [Phaeobacter inhibens]